MVKIICGNCNSDDVQIIKDRGDMTQFKCVKCGNCFTSDKDSFDYEEVEDE